MLQKVTIANAALASQTDRPIVPPDFPASRGKASVQRALAATKVHRAFGGPKAAAFARIQATKERCALRR
jgi:hypothetical protein